MTLDDWVWGRVKVALGNRWGVLAVGEHRYVVAQGARSGLRLARWIVGAKADQVVSYVNGNSMDLRTANLAVVDRGEFVARGLTVPTVAQGEGYPFGHLGGRCGREGLVGGGAPGGWESVADLLKQNKNIVLCLTCVLPFDC